MKIAKCDLACEKRQFALFNYQFSFFNGIDKSLVR